MDSDLINRALARANEATQANVSRPEATDEQVSARIDMLLRWGYVSSEQTVEPIRAFLSGYSVLLSGDVGVGKTFLMKSMGVKCYKAPALSEYKSSGIDIWYDSTDKATICIDDLGTEDQSNNYGIRSDLLRAIIDHRCELRGVKTHITTNMDASSLGERYDDRTLNRIIGMCKVFRMTGESRRKAESQNACRQEAAPFEVIARYASTRFKYKLRGATQEQLEDFDIQVMGQVGYDGYERMMKL